MIYEILSINVLKVAWNFRREPAYWMCRFSENPPHGVSDNVLTVLMVIN
jgi:hypothetical protein